MWDKRLAVLALVLGLAAGCGGKSNGGETDAGVPDAAEVQPDVMPQDQEAPDGDAAVDEGPEIDVAPDQLEWQGIPVTILHLNDLHARLQGFAPEADYTPATTGDDDTIGGVARIASIIKQVKDEVGADNVLVLDGGDFTMGTLFEFVSATEGGELKVLDALGVVATTLGNHEFDWGLAAAAQIVTAGKQGTGIHVVASNLVPSESDAGDDAFAGLLADGTVEKTLLLDLPSGLKVGILGLLGENAAEDAPFMAPLTRTDINDAGKAAAAELRASGADLVVALSHSGCVDGGLKLEDDKLAESDADIDVIVSAHSHEPLTAPKGDADTVIVHAGDRGRFVGRLDLLVFPDKVVVKQWKTLPVDDSVPGDAAILGLVEELKGEVDKALADLGLSYSKPVVETGFDLVQTKVQETGLGNLISDALLAGCREILAAQNGPVPMAAFEANGVIRDSILKGKTGVVQFADLFRILPLGNGPDGVPGYPMVLFYVTADELRVACESTLAIPALVGELGDTYFVQYSGLRCTYDPDAMATQQVVGVYLKEGDAYSDTPLDLSAENQTLYPVVVNFYIATMMANLEKLSMGLLKVTPKNADGTTVTDFATVMLDRAPETPVVDEVKNWELLADFVSAFPDADGDALPDMPASYAQSEGRMTEAEQP